MSNTDPTPIPREAPRHLARELVARYLSIFRAAWAARHELAGPKRLADEAAFLPAALSLRETPVHPAPRRLAWALMLLFVIALVGSIVGRLDIVAVAPGRVIVSYRTKIIQPLETSVVKAVWVQDGDRVRAGQVLIALDPTMATADKASVHEQRRAALSEKLRTQALLHLLSQRKPLAHVTGAMASDMGAQLVSEWQDISAKLAKLEATRKLRQAEISTAQEAIAKLEATVPMAQQREADYKKLVDQGYISGHATQDKTRDRVELERDLATQRARLAETQAAAAEAQAALTSFVSETQRSLSDRLAQTATRHSQLDAESTKATQREKLTQLTAPVDGVVQQLAVHSVGGVVTAAQSLMVVVPEHAAVTAEVAVANQDIGFVNPGQRVTVKLETFPYTRYGTVEAVVQRVAADAVMDEKKGSYYPAILTLHQRDMWVDGKRMALSPGMNLTAEIKTGRRRVIEYLLSPLQRAGSESLRER